MSSTQRVKHILVTINAIGPETAVEAEMRLNEDLGVDSLAMVRLISAIRNEFGLQVKARDMTPENFATVSSLETYLARHVGQAERSRDI